MTIIVSMWHVLEIAKLFQIWQIIKSADWESYTRQIFNIMIKNQINMDVWSENLDVWNMDVWSDNWWSQLY